MHHFSISDGLPYNQFQFLARRLQTTIRSRLFMSCIVQQEAAIPIFVAMRKIGFILTLAIVVVVSLYACGPKQANEKITIVATTGIVGDCVRELVGDQAVVISLMGAGVDPHLYRASQGDIEKLINADIIVYSGLHLEGKMAKMLENYAQQKPTFAVGEYVDKTKLKRVDETSDLVDPHIWFGPKTWLQGLEGVAKELDKIEGLEGTLTRYATYKQNIDETTTNLKAKLATELPDTSKRILITSHDAFEYFGEAFGFQVRGLQGISTAAEYGTKDVKNLVDFIIDNNIKSVFVETSVSDKNLRAVIEGANARDYKLNIGGTLYSDALGADNTPAGTYKGMLEANVLTIISGLK